MADEDKKWWQPTWLNGDSVRAFVRLIMGGFGIALFGIGTNILANGNADNATLAGVAIGGGGFCLIFFFLTQFKKFKGFGIEAESWEREMEDAKRITTNLRNLSQLVAEPSMMVLMRTGRWGSGTSRREAHDLVSRFKELLIATEAPKEDIERAVSDYFRYTLFDMVNQLRKPLKNMLDKKINPFNEAVRKFGNPVTDLAGHSAACEASREASKKAERVLESLTMESISVDGFSGVLDALRDCDLLSDTEIDNFLETHKDVVADIRFLEEHKKLRRPEVWFDSEAVE